jgi:hypothetical protein
MENAMNQKTWLDGLDTTATRATTRRGVARALSVVVAGLSPVTLTASVAAKKGGKGKNKCQKQEVACQDFLGRQCQQTPFPALCQSLIDQCCTPLGQCRAADFFVCLIETATFGQSSSSPTAGARGHDAARPNARSRRRAAAGE